MKRTITSLGGRAPPGRKTPPPSSESHWRVSVRRLHAGAVSAPRVPSSSDPRVSRYRARPAAPSAAAPLSCSLTSRRRIASWPTGTDARGRGQTPSGRRGHATQGRTCWVGASGPSSLGMGPPINPVRFIVACGTVYQPPAETSIYIGVTTVQNTISNIGSRLTYSSNQIDGFLQYLLFSTWEGSVTASGSVHSDRNGKYYLLNAKVPANWFWNYESGVCAGHGDDNDFYKGNVFDLVCTVVISSAYAYGFSADGS